MVEKIRATPQTLEQILAECKRLREQSKRIQERARALAEKVEVLKKRSPKSA